MKNHQSPLPRSTPHPPRILTNDAIDNFQIFLEGLSNSEIYTVLALAFAELLTRGITFTLFGPHPIRKDKPAPAWEAVKVLESLT